MTRRMCCNMLLGAVAGALGVSGAGCSRYRTFRFSFSNRTEDLIMAKIDGEPLGTVEAGTTAKFEKEIYILSESPTGSGSEVARVTASAENLETGKVTRGFERDVYRDKVNHFDINASDFLP